MYTCSFSFPFSSCFHSVPGCSGTTLFSQAKFVSCLLTNMQFCSLVFVSWNFTNGKNTQNRHKKIPPRTCICLRKAKNSSALVLHLLFWRLSARDGRQVDTHTHTHTNRVLYCGSKCACDRRVLKNYTSVCGAGKESLTRLYRYSLFFSSFQPHSSLHLYHIPIIVH